MNRIDPINYFILVEDDHPFRNFPVAQTIKIIRTRYCSPMNAKGLCTGECINCKTNMVAIRNGMRGIPNLKSPFGFLTWLCRNQVAITSERELEQPTVIEEKDWLGEKVETKNPFKEFVKGIPK